MLKILVDGYNVMHKMKSIKPLLRSNLEASRETFVETMQSYLKGGGASVRMVVVFDGKNDPAHSSGFTREHGRLKIMFSRPPKTADTLLVQLMDEEQEPRQLLIVSSDRDITVAAKCRSIKTQSSEDFIEKLHGTPRRPAKETPQLTKGEVEYWMNIFKKK